MMVGEKKSLIKRLFRIPEEKNTIYWLIEKQNRWWVQILDFVGFALLFWLVYEEVQPVVALFLALYLHELGHLAVFQKSGIKTILILLFPLGAMAAPITEEENKRSDTLPWWNIGWLLLMGPAMNVALIVVGWVLVNFNLWSEFGHDLAEINIALAILNLLPVWKLDGGQFFKVIFASLDEKRDRIFQTVTIIIYALVLTAVFVPAFSGNKHTLLATIWNNGPFILFVIILTIGELTRHKKETPAFSDSSQAMSVKQVTWQMLFYGLLVAVTFIVFSLLY